jgi:hypothetical protein
MTDITAEFVGSLSEDLMIKIAAFLDLSWCCRLRVSRVFRFLIDKNVLNKISDVKGDQLYSSNGFNSLLPYLAGMKSLSLTSCTWLDDQHLSDLGKFCPVLQSLDLSGCENISDSGIEALAQGCLELKAVDLTFCSQTTYSCVLILMDLCGPDIVVGSHTQCAVRRPFMQRLGAVRSPSFPLLL